MSVVVIGLVLYLVQHGKAATDYDTFQKTAFDFSAFLNGLTHGSSEAIIALGVICLIATPVMRVVFAIIGFWLEQDYLYTAIALLVLIIIISSMLLGAV